MHLLIRVKGLGGKESKLNWRQILFSLFDVEMLIQTTSIRGPALCIVKRTHAECELSPVLQVIVGNKTHANLYTHKHTERDREIPVIIRDMKIYFDQNVQILVQKAFAVNYCGI